MRFRRADSRGYADDAEQAAPSSTANKLVMDERVHQPQRLKRQRMRANGSGMGAHHRIDGRTEELVAHMATQITIGNDADQPATRIVITPTQPKLFWVITIIASAIAAPVGDQRHGIVAMHQIGDLEQFAVRACRRDEARDSRGAKSPCARAALPPTHRRAPASSSSMKSATGPSGKPPELPAAAASHRRHWRENC